MVQPNNTANVESDCFDKTRGKLVERWMIGDIFLSPRATLVLICILISPRRPGTAFFLVTIRHALNIYISNRWCHTACTYIHRATIERFTLREREYELPDFSLKEALINS